MNILPKKSWHVRTKKNIERVRKDEAQAAEVEKERLRKIALAESEARTDILRERARKHIQEGNSNAQLKSHDEKQVAPSSSEGHINFFEELEEGTKQDKKCNKEYEEEKRQEKEKQEKAIGLLTYLGQSAVEAQTSKPWYFKPPEKKVKTAIGEDAPSRDRAKDELDTKSKYSLDPMRHMTKYIEKTKKVRRRRDRDDSYREKKHKHKHKKHKESEESSSEPRPKTLEQLRAERLRREREEREKTEKLLAKLRGEKIPGEKQEEPTDERERQYNSQFNPNLVRKRKPRSNYQY